MVVDRLVGASDIVKGIQGVFVHGRTPFFKEGQLPFNLSDFPSPA
jgi:hypothetical protein